MKNNCFQFERISDSPKACLFCFHYAGGSAFNYIPWQKYISDDIDIFPYQSAGRGNRRNEKPSPSIIDIVNETAEQVSHFADKTIIFTGHSMGGLIAYLTACKLRKSYDINVKKLFITGSVPNLTRALKERCGYHKEMNNNDFCKMILKFGAVNEKSLALLGEHTEFIDLIKSDFDLIAEYKSSVTEMLNSDINVYCGSKDDVADKYSCKQWQACTTGNVIIKEYNGEHFFINRWYKEICSDISAFINERRIYGKQKESSNNRYSSIMFPRQQP